MNKQKITIEYPKTNFNFEIIEAPALVRAEDDLITRYASMVRSVISVSDDDEAKALIEAFYASVKMFLSAAYALENGVFAPELDAKGNPASKEEAKIKRRLKRLPFYTAFDQAMKKTKGDTNESK